MCLIQVFNQFGIHIEQKSFIFYLDIHWYLPPLLNQSFWKEFNLVFYKGSTFRFLQLIMSFVVKWKYVNLPLYLDIFKKLNNLQQMIKRQIKDISIQKGNWQVYVDSIRTTFPNNLFTNPSQQKNTSAFFHFLSVIPNL